MAGYTLAQLRTKLSYYLDDNSLVRWPLAEQNDYLNQAYLYYYNELINMGYAAVLTTPVLLNTTSGVETVPLPADFYKAKVLYKVLPTIKRPCRYREPYATTVLLTGASSIYVPDYCFRGTNLVLNPVPSDTVTGSLELHYWPVLTLLVNDSDTLVAGFSAEWQDMIPLRAALQAKSLREEEDVANIANFLAVAEKPFNDMRDSMTMDRVRTDAFFTGQDETYIY